MKVYILRHSWYLILIKKIVINFPFYFLLAPKTTFATLECNFHINIIKITCFLINANDSHLKLRFDSFHNTIDILCLRIINEECKLMFTITTHIRYSAKHDARSLNIVFSQRRFFSTHMLPPCEQKNSNRKSLDVNWNRKHQTCTYVSISIGEGKLLWFLLHHSHALFVIKSVESQSRS
jgi:hypothetical protein